MSAPPGRISVCEAELAQRLHELAKHDNIVRAAVDEVMAGAELTRQLVEALEMLASERARLYADLVRYETGAYR